MVNAKSLDELGEVYVIGWTSNITGHSWYGKKRFRYSVACGIANEANRKNPELSHTVMSMYTVQLGRVVERS